MNNFKFKTNGNTFINIQKSPENIQIIVFLIQFLDPFLISSLFSIIFFSGCTTSITYISWCNKLFFADKAVYEGEFRDNEINGTGVYVWIDKKRYNGEWKNNKMHGQGTLQWPDGKVYKGILILIIKLSNFSFVGEFKDNRRNGEGIFKWKDGKTYEGEWKDGKQHGRGKFITGDGKVTQGVWEKGKRI